MLGKLFKHEWKRVYKLECLLLAIMTVFTVVEAIMFYTPMTDFLRKSHYNSNDPITIIWTMLFIMSIFACVIVMIGLTYGHIIFIGWNFEKTMYSDEGYLTHTLPVTPHQLLISKLLVGGIWTLIMGFAMCVCMFILGASLVTAAADVNIFAELQDLISEIDFSKADIGLLMHYGVSYVIMLIGGPFCTICTLYGALTIGQLSKKHKGLMGIITYFAINFATTMLANIFNTIGSVVTMANHNYSPHTALFFGMDMTMLIMAAVAICLYFLSHYIIVKKLNLN